MNRPSLELRDAEYHLMVARRRAAHFAQFSPEWEAAMEIVRKCEQHVCRLDDRAIEHVWLGIAASAT